LRERLPIINSERIRGGDRGGRGGGGGVPLSSYTIRAGVQKGKGSVLPLTSNMEKKRLKFGRGRESGVFLGGRGIQIVRRRYSALLKGVGGRGRLLKGGRRKKEAKDEQVLTNVVGRMRGRGLPWGGRTQERGGIGDPSLKQRQVVFGTGTCI